MKKIISGILCLVLLASASFAQQNFEKKYEKNFPVNARTLMKVSNKYGKIHIENCEDNSLKIRAIVKCEDKKESNAKALFESVKISLDKKGELITATTEITKSLNNIDFSINYYIEMPASLPVNLENKYGTIFADKLHSSSSINCKYGSLQINEWLSENAEKPGKLLLKYSKGTINKADYLDAEIKYSELNLDKSRIVYLESGYSKIRCREAYILKSDSKYDPVFKVNKAAKIDLEGKYGTYDIENIGKEMKAEIGYSSLNINQPAADFQKIDIEGKYSNVEIRASEESSFTLEAETEYGLIINKLKENPSHKKRRSTYLKTFVGKNKNAQSKIKATLAYGNLRLE